LGKETVAVYSRPRVAVLATGDELVSVNRVPGPGQIRNSNEVMLAAQLRQMGAIPVPLGVARDVHDELREAISRGLACEMLLLSGGVSAGKLDLVPDVLADLGVREVFHKVRVKPGQPVWFGIMDSHLAGDQKSNGGLSPTSEPARSPCYVFGLPGNPVSSMVCCELFARTAVRRLMGIEPATPQVLRSRLLRDHFNGGNRPTYHPARWELADSGPVVEPVKWVGSSDLSATVEANAMALFLDGGRMYPAGTMLDVILW
jgi:molybdopterin molybdotransferase